MSLDHSESNDAALVREAAGEADKTTLVNTTAALYDALGEVIGVLSRDPRFRHFSIADLEWAVLPALLSGQYVMARGTVRPPGNGKQPATPLPIGLAMWARVSPEVDAKLKRQLADNSGYRLAPAEWASGDIVWLLSMSGRGEVLPALLERVRSEALGGKEFREHTWAAPPLVRTARGGKSARPGPPEAQLS